MLKKDFEQSEAYKDMCLIGASYAEMEFKFIGNGQDLACYQHGKNYHVNYWFQIMIMYFGYKAQSINGDESRLAFLGEARSNFVQLAENAKRMLAEVEWCKRYEFSGFVNQVDALIQMGKIELEAKLLISQLDTNKSTASINENVKETNENIRITNQNIRDTNRSLKSIFKWTAIIAGIGVFIAAINTILEVRKDNQSQQLHMKDSLLQVKDSEISLLRKPLDYSHRKP